MKFFSRFLYHTSAYTVIITMLFFAFAKLSGLEATPSVTFGRYFLIFAFSMLISAAEYIFGIDSLPRYAKFAVHYLVLAIAFFFIFLTVRSASETFVFNAATIFASLIVFSFLYFAALGLFLLFKNALTPNPKTNKPSSRGKK